jgi:hypothetical protein
LNAQLGNYVFPHIKVFRERLISSTFFPFRQWKSNTRIKTQLHSKASAIPTRHVGILGGGLAGLALAHNLFEKSEFSSSLHITIYDTAPVGQGGASAVAGGYVHSL